MFGLEMAALALGVFNGAVLAIRPLARFHSRLDEQDAQLRAIERAVIRLENRLDSKLAE